MELEEQTDKQKDMTKPTVLFTFLFFGLCIFNNEDKK